MTTEEANINRVKLKKMKTPNTQTEDTTSHKQTSGRKRTPQKGKVMEIPTMYALENASFVEMFMR